jgi:AraC-like DNA-binding protein
VIAICGVFTFACVVIFKSLKQPMFLDHCGEDKQKTNKLDKDVRLFILQKIQGYMENSTPYLETDFDLAALAQGINTPAYRVSQVINAELQQNFFDFVNAYRIGECCRLLKNNDKSITEIMYAAGFNSKSVFNTTFKKHTGLTPSQYRKSPEALQFQ